MRKIKVVVLLVQQLQHGFIKNANVSPNLTVAHIVDAPNLMLYHKQLAYEAVYPLMSVYNVH